ncbi:Serpentine receptor class delta-51 [Caenorhabditis elegans]|uniref:Serpentine receptor class delta-51 n=1 Tax=Caenorhabditis elegans TaxID=6239 RepID=SRD51_CAEEL|nr:Serpentine receptor class delta-51 [Caenorhabditis elegans]Q19473.2 RecName: Full=Serpentine receptor class delta-51; Short=Protein srd-51 [Caenorhabditis elegans]CAA94132.1 Serpentine receptor class delta-51 [Caenorhabditis elegans]|eukprot:NP_510252.1 Serpentine receptor class delta-51 [Caenorhabditis elegans]
MSEVEKKLEMFVTVYYSLNVTLALSINILLLFIMKTTKSSLLKDMQYYLFNTALFEIIVSLSTYFAQCRPVANKSTLAVFCHGPCKYFGKNTCFVTFAVVQCSVVAASFSILLSFYYRYRLLKVNFKKKHKHATTFIIFSFFPTVMLLFQLLTDSNFAIVEAETREMHPDYDYVNNALIGFSDSKSPAAIIAQSLISLGVYMSPLIAFHYRRKINKILSTNTGQRIPVAYCKQLINGLLIQTLIPFCVYIPPYSYFLYSQLSGHSNLYFEYLLNIFGSFTAFINPLLTFYFVLPYRRALCKKVFKYFPSISEEGTEITTFPTTVQFQRGHTASTKF